MRSRGQTSAGPPSQKWRSTIQRNRRAKHRISDSDDAHFGGTRWPRQPEDLVDAGTIIAEVPFLIAMSGGCRGYSASQVTLKYGFELIVRRIAPEIVDIVDTTDHASGTKPFYQHAGEVQ
jgi:hypothetical protein